MLTQELLKECFTYDLNTGIFTWNKRPLNHFKKEFRFHSWNKIYSNSIAGNIHKRNGYVYISIFSKEYFAHRLAWFYVHGYLPKNGIDHINGIRHDNRIINLREANQSENCQNIRKCKKNNKSTGILCTYPIKNSIKFKSVITINGKRKYLGTFDSKEDAYSSYLKEKRNIHPFNTI